jgi:hypothetical protein
MIDPIELAPYPNKPLYLIYFNAKEALFEFGPVEPNDENFKKISKILQN